MGALAPYTSLEQVYDQLGAFGSVDEYGRSHEGRPLCSVTVGSGPTTAMITAGLHGLEYIGVEVLLEVLRTGPIDGVRLIACPVLNPDGYARTWAQDGDGPVGQLRKNARGVDLNRNFPIPMGGRPTAMPFSGSLKPTATTYRGPTPLSEPETQALAALVRNEMPQVSVNLHSFMGTLICARVTDREDWEHYNALVAAFQEAQERAVPYLRLGSTVFDVFTGELEDWQHHVAGCWAVCVECFALDESISQHWRAPSSFWRFNPRDPAAIAHRDAQAVRAMLAAGCELRRRDQQPGTALGHW